jgi:phage repressor protein C with HTH and peptisase S24 domain
VLTGGKPEQIKDGMLYVLRYGTDLRVKRLRTTHTGGLILMSDNPRYPEEEISASDAEKYITVLGQVHWRGG